MELEEIYAIERAYHDRMARNHLGAVSVKPHEVAPWNQVRKVMGEIDGKRILDLGCGFGREAIWLAKNGANVTGVDLSSQSIACAERDAMVEGVKIEFIISPAEELTFHETFDIVLFRASLHHFQDTSCIVKIAYESLKPLGLIVAQEPLAYNPIAIIGRRTLNKPTPTEHPFIFGELDTIFDSIFGSHESRYFCIFSPISIAFSRTGHNTLSSFSFKTLNCIDLLLLPMLKRWAWIQVIWATK